MWVAVLRWIVWAIPHMSGLPSDRWPCEPAAIPKHASIWHKVLFFYLIDEERHPDPHTRSKEQDRIVNCKFWKSAFKYMRQFSLSVRKPSKCYLKHTHTYIQHMHTYIHICAHAHTVSLTKTNKQKHQFKSRVRQYLVSVATHRCHQSSSPHGDISPRRQYSKFYLKGTEPWDETRNKRLLDARCASYLESFRAAWRSDCA